MNAEKIVKITDGAYFVPSYSKQTIIPAFEVWGTVHSVGAADELQDEATDKEPVLSTDNPPSQVIQSYPTT